MVKIMTFFLAALSPDRRGVKTIDGVKLIRLEKDELFEFELWLLIC